MITVWSVCAYVHDMQAKLVGGPFHSLRSPLHTPMPSNTALVDPFRQSVHLAVRYSNTLSVLKPRLRYAIANSCILQEASRRDGGIQGFRWSRGRA